LREIFLYLNILYENLSHRFCWFYLRLCRRRIALLGMTFKANNDDTRESLSFKIKKMLEFRIAKVITHDPYMPNEMSFQETVFLKGVG